MSRRTVELILRRLDGVVRGASILAELRRVPAGLALVVAGRISGRIIRGLRAELRALLACSDGVSLVVEMMTDLPADLAGMVAVQLDPVDRQRLTASSTSDATTRLLTVCTRDVYTEAEHALERANLRADRGRAFVGATGAAAWEEAYISVATPPNDAPVRPTNHHSDDTWDPGQHERQRQHTLVEVGVPAASAPRVLRRTLKAGAEPTDQKRRQAEHDALTRAGVPEERVPSTLDTLGRLATPGYRKGQRGARGQDMKIRREQARAELTKALHDAGEDDNPAAIARLRDRVRQISGRGELRVYRQAASLVQRAHLAGMNKQLRVLLRPNVSHEDVLAAVDQIDARTIARIANLDDHPRPDPEIVDASRTANAIWQQTEFAPRVRTMVPHVLRHRQAAADGAGGNGDHDDDARIPTVTIGAAVQMGLIHKREG